jgi:hypothetical protein
MPSGAVVFGSIEDRAVSLENTVLDEQVVSHKFEESIGAYA